MCSSDRPRVLLGSVGVRAYLIMLFGNDKSDVLFLQMKEALAPIYAPYVPPLPQEFINHEGMRVVTGQIAMQASNDPLLGCALFSCSSFSFFFSFFLSLLYHVHHEIDTEMDGRKYYVRQMRNYKASIDPFKLDADSMIV